MEQTRETEKQGNYTDFLLHKLIQEIVCIDFAADSLGKELITREFRINLAKFLMNRAKKRSRRPPVKLYTDFAHTARVVKHLSKKKYYTGL